MQDQVFVPESVLVLVPLIEQICLVWCHEAIAFLHLCSTKADAALFGIEPAGLRICFVALSCVDASKSAFDLLSPNIIDFIVTG